MARIQKKLPTVQRRRSIRIHHGLTEQQKLRRIVESFSKVSVLVMADLIADEFISGEIARVSREAPVLILKHRDRILIPGGGANAVMNLAALGVTALPVGLVGDDEAGRALLQIFRKNKISVSGISKLKGHVTTTKTRVLAYSAHSSRQQVVRIDRECEALQGYSSRAGRVGRVGARVRSRRRCRAAQRLRLWRGFAPPLQFRPRQRRARRNSGHPRQPLSPVGLRRRHRRHSQRRGS